MYTSHFGFRKKPFSLLPDPDFLYLSPKHKKALSVLRYGLITPTGFTLITGEVGAGKTTLVKQALRYELEDSCIGVITNTHSAFGELLAWILTAFSIKPPSNDKVLLYQLFVDFIHEQFKQQKRVILIVDEAQNMDMHTLEELRLLSNINDGSSMMLQLILVGQPQLIDKLKSPDLFQFAQRISIEYHLTALDSEQTENYIRHRIAIAGGESDLFSPMACAAIFYYSGGVPRLINNICDLSLLFAFADDLKSINLQTVLDVVKEKKVTGITLNNQGMTAEQQKIRALVQQTAEIDLSNISG